MQALSELSTGWDVPTVAAAPDIRPTIRMARARRPMRPLSPISLPTTTLPGSTTIAEVLEEELSFAGNSEYIFSRCCLFVQVYGQYERSSRRIGKYCSAARDPSLMTFLTQETPMANSGLRIHPPTNQV